MDDNKKDDQDPILLAKDDEYKQESNEVSKKIESPISSFLNNNSGSFLDYPFDYFNTNDSMIFNTQNLPNHNFLLNNNNNEKKESQKPQIPSIFNFFKNPLPTLPTGQIFKTTVPYVGLLNQGSTCYMNSLLQALFHLPAFRRLVFEINDQNISKPDSENIPLNLKLLFARMQLHHDNKAISTEDLTKSFGWKEPQTFMQHDVQEFSRVLLENLEEKMKGTPLEKSINYIFGGNYITYIYTYSKSDDIQKENYINNEFYDISLDVSSNETQNSDNFQSASLIDDIYSAFDKYTEEEKLSGENQYQFEEKVKKDAFIKNKFVKMPRVLYLHLKRFQIDMNTNQSIKINSFFRFYKSINLTKYVADEVLQNTESIDQNSADLSKDSDDYESDKYQYDLFGILVHSGTSISGHYMAYLKPKMEEKWYQFNDSLVSEVDEDTAINENFGGVDKTSSAYMLIYIKRTDEKNLFHEVENEAIPKEIIEKIEKENQSNSNTIGLGSSSVLNNENNNKVIFYLFTEENTIKKNAFLGKLSFSCDREYATQLPMNKSSSLNSLYKNVAEFFQKDEKKIELWPQFLNEGLIDKLDNNSFKDLLQYPKSMNVFVFIKEDDLDLEFTNSNSIINDDRGFSIDDIFESNFDKFGIKDLLNNDNNSTIPIFVFIYCPLCKNPFTFLFSYEVDGEKSILNFLSLAIQKKLKKSNEESNIDIDYIKSIINIYIRKLNNALEKIATNEEETFSSCIKNGEIIKSVIFVIELNEWSRFKLPQIEDDSYAMDAYLSQKKKEENLVNNYNYLDYNIISNHKNMNAQQYYNYVNDINKIKIDSYGKEIEVTIPNLITISDFKTFLKLIFEKEIKSMINVNAQKDQTDSTNFKELLESAEVLLFKENEVNSIESKENDPILTVLAPNDTKLKAKFVDPTFLLIDDSIISFLLLDIFISFDSFIVENRTEEFVRNDSNVTDIISLINKKFFSVEDEKDEIRVLQLDKKGRKILRIIDQNEKVNSLSNPIRIEKVTKINETKFFIKVSFESKLKFDPFLINVSNEMNLNDIKEIVSENFKMQKQSRKDQDDEDDKNDDDLLFYFFNEKGEKITNLNNNIKIIDFTPQLTEIIVENKLNSKLIDRSVHLYN